jgi:hypothetical protein
MMETEDTLYNAFMAIVCVIRIECRSGFEEMKAIEFQNRSAQPFWTPASWRGGELKEAPVVPRSGFSEVNPPG